jgi:hypothetical protein
MTDHHDARLVHGRPEVDGVDNLLEAHKARLLSTAGDGPILKFYDMPPRSRICKYRA